MLPCGDIVKDVERKAGIDIRTHCYDLLATGFDQ